MVSKIRMFLETTSLRGFGKISRSESLFLRCLWLGFVLLTTCLLCYSVYKIVKDYLQFDVNIQTKLEIDDPTPFPVISICNNQPFSRNAYAMWKNKTVKSPTEFNMELRKRALKILSINKTDIERKSDLYQRLFGKGEKLSDEEVREVMEYREDLINALMTSLTYDSTRNYYQSLTPREAVQLGHTRNETIVDCAFKKGNNVAIGTRGCTDSYVNVKMFSHPNFFNCMSIEFNHAQSLHMDSMTLIIWLGPGEDYNIQYRQGFVFDVFEQAYGVRVTIHEPDTLPKIQENGIHIEPGKMNEVLYQPVKFIKENTPPNPCMSDSDVKNVKFKDLRNVYSYDQELCLNTKVQEAYMRRCKCLYIELPRISVPNKTIPYCAVLDEKTAKRQACAKKVDEESQQIRQELEATDCFPKCQDVMYEHQLSVTKWRDTQWQLFWMSEYGRRWNNFFETLVVGDHKSDLMKAMDGVLEYLSASNVTNTTPFASASHGGFKFDDRYTFLVVKRKSNNTLVKQEKIVLTPNALFSRLGGLGSIYIGLTLAFFIECVEFLYLAIFGKKHKSSKEVISKVIEVECNENCEEDTLMPMNEIARPGRQVNLSSDLQCNENFYSAPAARKSPGLRKTQSNGKRSNSPNENIQVWIKKDTIK